MAHVNRALVVELLSDGSLSYREIARRAACSDFSVRAIARSIDANGDDADRTPEPLTPRDWFAIAGILAFGFGGIWFLSRRFPPPDGAM